jgi:hypothetical protein
MKKHTDFVLVTVFVLAFIAGTALGNAVADSTIRKLEKANMILKLVIVQISKELGKPPRLKLPKQKKHDNDCNGGGCWL